MVNIRQALPSDLLAAQQCNLLCLPENYAMRYYLYHLLAFPHLLYVAEDGPDNVVGYVLGKLEWSQEVPRPQERREDQEAESRGEEAPQDAQSLPQPPKPRRRPKQPQRPRHEPAAVSEARGRGKAVAVQHGHIISLAVLRSHRRLGLAQRLMQTAHHVMRQVYQVPFVSLHVRANNEAAKHLYMHTMGYVLHKVEKQYYADGEDAHELRLWLASEPTRDASNNGPQSSRA
ncbi:hypothetical protein CDCA_CDCA02G0591 [Cyanidium caldarium]|uniref:N-acetyltransferase domain-containing protein n=1 Tax=Cyanidium caldarium TaxID=2771 RepID=A0AAV9IR67_CYACA|nr:hypothetical protein CDCA_CDCA02G0591 [Cyanidium caldarium]